MTVYLDIETTALFDRGYTVEPIEIAYWQDGGGPARIVLPHTLVNADPDALRINRYYERHLDDPSMWDGRDALDGLRSTLVANQIAGSAPWFDERVLLGLFGRQVWDHHLIDVPTYYAGAVGIEGSLGLAGSVQHAKQHFGVFFEQEPNHTAMGDTAAARTLHKWALNYNQIRSTR